MTSHEFVIWLRGFVAGSNNYTLTPKGWDEVKEKLNDITDTDKVSTILTVGGSSTATTLPAGTTVNFTTSDKNLLHD